MALATSFNFPDANLPVEQSPIRLLGHDDTATFEPIPSMFGKGHVETLKLGPEMGFTITTHRPEGDDLPEKITVNVRTEGPIVRILSALETAPTTMGIVGDDRELAVTAPQLSIASPGSELFYNDIPSKPYRAAALLISLNRMVNAWEDEGAASIPERFAFLRSCDSSEPLFENLPFHPELQGLFLKVFTCPYRGAPQRLYLEGLGLEIAGMVLSSLENPDSGKKTPLRPRDRKRMENAREFLNGEAAHPPSMQNLARELGVSVSKLKRDFKTFTGVPIHAYIIQRRLDMAKELLSTGDASVKEASYAVGFKSQSHFAQIYRSRFGQYPSEVGKV